MRKGQGKQDNCLKAPRLHAFSTRISSPLNSNLKPTQETYVSCESRTKAASVKTFKDRVPSAPSSKGVTAEKMQKWSLHWRKIKVETSQRSTESQNLPCHVQRHLHWIMLLKPDHSKIIHTNWATGFGSSSTLLEILWSGVILEAYYVSKNNISSYKVLT